MLPPPMTAAGQLRPESAFRGGITRCWGCRPRGIPSPRVWGRFATRPTTFFEGHLGGEGCSSSFSPGSETTVLCTGGGWSTPRRTDLQETDLAVRWRRAPLRHWPERRCRLRQCPGCSAGPRSTTEPVLHAGAQGWDSEGACPVAAAAPLFHGDPNVPRAWVLANQGLLCSASAALPQ